LRRAADRQWKEAVSFSIDQLVEAMQKQLSATPK
jgi:hypothetical protein